MELILPKLKTDFLIGLFEVNSSSNEYEYNLWNDISSELKQCIYNGLILGNKSDVKTLSKNNYNDSFIQYDIYNINPNYIKLSLFLIEGLKKRINNLVRPDKVKETLIALDNRYNNLKKYL